MKKNTHTRHFKKDLNRRDLLKASAAGAIGLVGVGPLLSSANAFPTSQAPRNKPNILFIMTDQQHINTIAAGGCAHVQTPNMDRLYNNGVRFSESYCPSPVCIPGRSSVFTGRMPTETGNWFNSARSGNIEKSIPTVGELLGQKAGYESVYAGKWHVPLCHTYNIRGFRVISSGLDHWGDVSDELVSRACAGYLMNRDKSNPFFLVCSLIQPHDICVWLSINMKNQKKLRYPQIENELPQLPDNFEYDRAEPEPHMKLRDSQQPNDGKWSKLHWRYYLWNYYRHVEMVDAEIGRVLRALEESGQADNTLIVFTSDHGEGMGEHQMVRKGYLYDSAAKVPLIFTMPGRIQQGRTNTQLVAGYDLTPTFCDFAGIEPTKDMVGTSLRQVLESGNEKIQRPLGNFVVTEKGSPAKLINETGRMIRSENYKYIKYYGYDTDQLFDVKNDPGESKNLANNAKFASVVSEHKKMLCQWENNLKLAPRVIEAGGEKWRTI